VRNAESTGMASLAAEAIDWSSRISRSHRELETDSSRQTGFCLPEPFRFDFGLEMIGPRAIGIFHRRSGEAKVRRQRLGAASSASTDRGRDGAAFWRNSEILLMSIASLLSRSETETNSSWLSSVFRLGTESIRSIGLHAFLERVRKTTSVISVVRVFALVVVAT